MVLETGDSGQMTDRLQPLLDFLPRPSSARPGFVGSVPAPVWNYRRLLVHRGLSTPTLNLEWARSSLLARCPAQRHYSLAWTRSRHLTYVYAPPDVLIG